MAYMERKRLTKESDLDDNTTWRYKLPSVGSYTALEMRINCNRDRDRADSDAVHTLADCISKVELLKAGAEVVKSLTGTQLDAMNYWDFKRPNPRRYRQVDIGGNDLILFLLGGRGIYDKEFGFDFSKLGETFLEYTYDLNEGDPEYFEAGDHDISLYGYRWLGPGVPAFKGYFRDRQLSAWTTTGDGDLKTVEIPIGRNIRRIAVQAKTRAKTLGGTFDNLELQVNRGEHSPVLVKSPMDWVMAEVQEYGLHNELGGIEYRIAGEATDLPYWFSYYDTVLAIDYITNQVNPVVMGLLTIPARLHSDTATAGEDVFKVSGWGFQKCLRIGFDHEHDLSDIFPTAGLGSLDLICEEAAESLEAACFYQDVVLY